MRYPPIAILLCACAAARATPGAPAHCRGVPYASLEVDVSALGSSCSVASSEGNWWSPTTTLHHVVRRHSTDGVCAMDGANCCIDVICP